MSKKKKKIQTQVLSVDLTMKVYVANFMLSI